MAKRQLGKMATAVALGLGLQFAGASAAQAAKKFGAVESTPFTGSSMTVYGSGKGAIDNTSLDDFKPNFQQDPGGEGAAAVPEPAAWLTMLLGFGILGAMTRRGTRTPVEIQRGL